MNLWLDEAVSIFTAKQSLHHILSNKDFHPPLFSLVLKFWMYLFGESLFILRLLPVFCAIIIVVYSIELFKMGCKDKTLKEFFILNLILSTTFLYHATQIRMYMMGLMFVVLTYYLMKKQSKYFFIPLALAVYTHYFTILAFIPLMMKRENWRQIGVAVVLFLPYLPTTMMQIINRLRIVDWYKEMTINSFLSNFFNYVFHVETFNSPNLLGVGIVIAFIYLIFNIRSIFFYIPSIYMIFSYFLGLPFHPRYFFFLSVFFLINAVKRCPKYLLVGITFMNIILLAGFIYEQDYELRDYSLTIKENEILLHESTFSLFPMMYYLPENEHRLLSDKNIESQGGYLVEHLKIEIGECNYCHLVTEEKINYN